MPSAGVGPARGATHLVEVLDRVLDRGIVIDAEIRLSVAGLALAGIEVRIVVAAIETYLEYAEELGNAAPASWLMDAPEARGTQPRNELDFDIRHRTRGFLDGIGDDLS